jgi:membrane protein EpsK
MIAPLAVNLSVFPMFGLALTVNKVRGPGVLTLVLGLLHIVVAWLLVEKAGWGMYGVAASAILLLSLKNVFYIPWYTARAVGSSTLSMLAPVLRVGVVTVAVWAVAAGVSHLWLVDGWVSFFAAGSVAGLMSAMLIYFVLLPQADRVIVRSAVRRIKEKYMRGSGV